VPRKEYLRGILLHYFIKTKSAVEAHRILSEIYGDHALSETTCRYWFRCYKNNDFDVEDIEDKECSSVPKKFRDEKLGALLHKDVYQMLAELAESLGVDHTTVSKCLKVLGMIQRQHWDIGCQLKSKDVERRLFTCEHLLQWQKRKGFLHHIVTGDEKWIHYDNPKRRIS